MSGELTRWGDSQQYEAAPLQGPGITVRALQVPIDPLGGVAAMRRMYGGKPTYSLREISHVERMEAWEDMMNAHLQAPLEAIQMHFFIEGVDRAFTHQLVRQRTATYAQESMRFAVVGELADKVQLPVSIRSGSAEAESWNAAILAIQQAYDFLVNNGVPAEEARGLLPHAVPTRVHYVTNMRALLEHAGNRLCTQAQYVWRIVFAMIVNELRAQEPEWQWRVITERAFKPVCYRLGHCPFEATFDRDCKIRRRVREGRWDEINDAEWALDPAAARR
jgi:flavin-dependent thymidylate synthase